MADQLVERLCQMVLGGNDLPPEDREQIEAELLFRRWMRQLHAGVHNGVFNPERIFLAFKTIGTEEEAKKVYQTAIGKHNREKHRIDTALKRMRKPSLSGGKVIEEFHLSICVEETYWEEHPHKVARISKPKAA